jgi:DNA-3-methyladenine glycosylase I
MNKGIPTKHRCSWASSDPLCVLYHDHEWGVLVHDDRKLFEMLILEGPQAGLSWITILKKRETYRKAFDSFDAKKVKQLLNNDGIVRNRLKIKAAIQNAPAFLAIRRWTAEGHSVEVIT